MIILYILEPLERLFCRQKDELRERFGPTPDFIEDPRLNAVDSE